MDYYFARFTGFGGGSNSQLPLQLAKIRVSWTDRGYRGGGAHWRCLVDSWQFSACFDSRGFVRIVVMGDGGARQGALGKTRREER